MSFSSMSFQNDGLGEPLVANANWLYASFSEHIVSTNDDPDDRVPTNSHPIQKRGPSALRSIR